MNTDRPIIVCLCGSTRFYKEFQEANLRETLAGKIVLTVGVYAHAFEEAHARIHDLSKEQKTQLDALHKRKIDFADEILIINVDKYIGESTQSELEYARSLGKKIRWLEEPSPDLTIETIQE